MTLAEKLTMIQGSPDATCAGIVVSPTVNGCMGQAGYVPGVARLGIPPLRFADGPAGAKLVHVATALPAPIGLAATFDEDAAAEYGALMGREGRALNQDVLLAPMLNLVTIPTAGRAFETLGEDPYLAGRLVAAEVRGIQAEGMIATLKHLAMNQFEKDRTSTSVSASRRTIIDLEMRIFGAGVDAGAGAVMCAYNRLNGVRACSSAELQREMLKGELGFDGWIVSDWGAARRSSDLIHGLDMIMPGGTPANGWDSSTLTGFLTSGSPAVALTNDLPAVPGYTPDQWREALDDSVRRILRQMNRAGLLEGTIHGSQNDGGPPWVPPRPDLASLREEHSRIALRLARQSATLLKNEGNALPLRRPGGLRQRDLGDLLVIGPTAAAAYVGGLGSSRVRPYDPVVSPFEALSRAAGPAGPSYVAGYDLDGVPVPPEALTSPEISSPYPHWTLRAEDAALSGLPGLLRQQITLAPVPSGEQPVFEASAARAPDQVDSTIDYVGDRALGAGTAWRWTGLLTAPATGEWRVTLFVAGQSRAELYVDGLLESDRAVFIGGFPEPPARSFAHLAQAERSHDPRAPALQQASWMTTLAEGEERHVDLRVTGSSSRPLQVRLRWIPPDRKGEAIAEAVASALAHARVLIFAYVEGQEGRDRGGDDPAAGLALPGYQDELISAVAAANENTIVVLNTGGAVLMPWIDDVRAVLVMWYPGQMGGQATADVLLGRSNPGGRLPVTFPAASVDYPQYDPSCTDTSLQGNCPLYPGAATVGFLGADPHGFRTIDFRSNGSITGHRWYSREGVEPLFPFGHGLSYTTFEYSDLSIAPRADGSLAVSFRIRNAGAAMGDETPQIYLAPGRTKGGFAGRIPASLVQFTRITLAPGESRLLTLHVERRSAPGRPASDGSWRSEAGRPEVLVGASSGDIRLRGSVGGRP
jgi:beta-glucosidase